MSLSPYGRIRVNVTGARGAIGIDFDGDINPGEFIVKSPGGSRKFSGASGTSGADSALRTDLAGGAGSALVKYTPPAAAQVADRSVQDRLRDNATSIMDCYLPTDPDFTLSAQRILATGKNIYLPSKADGYTISDGLVMQSGGQQIIGDGAFHSYFRVKSNFNPSAEGIISIKQTDNEYQSGLTNVGILCEQPSSPSSAADLIKYPWAINAFNVSRMSFGGVIRIVGAWNGLNFSGNTGGLVAEDFEISAFNRPYIFDGALDSVHITTLKLWPFGFADDPQALELYTQALGGYLGRVDGLDIKTIAHFAQPLVVDTTSGGVGIGTIGSLQLDGVSSTLTWNNHRYRVGLAYSTSSTANSAAISVNGGFLSIGSLDLQGGGQGVTQANSAPIINLVGGQLQISKPLIQGVGPAQTVILQTGGFLELDGGIFNTYPNIHYTVPLINIAGGRATINKPRFTDNSTANNTAIQVASDNFHDIEINALQGWLRSVPGNVTTSTFRFGTTIVGPAL